LQPAEAVKVQTALVLRAPLTADLAAPDESPGGAVAPEPVWRLLATAVFAAAAALCFAAVVILGAPGNGAPDAGLVVVPVVAAGG
jgi:anti-sigma-K factor RskA